MIVMGLLSILQMCFLPGFLLVLIAGLYRGIIKTIVLSVAFSLALNHFLVTAFIAGNIYTQTTLISLIVIEFLAVAVFLAFGAGRFWDWSIRQETKQWINFLQVSLGTDQAISIKARIGVGVFCFVFGFLALMDIVRNLGGIFTAWDAIVSWNRWAVSWAEGTPPGDAGYYPQVLPSVWSLSYVLIGDTRIQFFTSWISSFFPLLLFLGIIDLAPRLKRYGFLIAAPLFILVTYFYLGPTLPSSGYADVPVAFMVFSAFYMLLIAAQCTNQAEIIKHIIFGGALAGSSALTKQAGLYALFAYPIVAILLIGHNGVVPRKNLLKAIFAAFAIAVLVAAPWYIWTEYRMQTGRATGNIAYVMFGSVHKDRGPLLRLLHSANLLLKPFAYIGILFFVVPIANAIKHDRQMRILALVVMLPFTIAWALLLSYDRRNLALAYPFFAMVAGVGYENLKIPVFMRSRKLWLAGTVLILINAALFVHLVNSTNDGERLLKRQDYKEMTELGNAKLNTYLYLADEEGELRGKILSNYLILTLLPRFKDITRHHSNPDNTREVFEDALASGEYQYFVNNYRWRNGPVFLEALKKAASEGRVKNVYTESKFSLWEKTGD